MTPRYGIMYLYYKPTIIIIAMAHVYITIYDTKLMLLVNKWILYFVVNTSDDSWDHTKVSFYMRNLSLFKFVAVS